MTPHEARDGLIRIIKHSASLLDVDGWKQQGDVGVDSCSLGNTEGVKYYYVYVTPQPGKNHLADAKKIAAYWRSVGMSVRMNTEHEPVLFATGGGYQGISFSTGPGNYYFAGTSSCVPGNADKLRDREYVE